MYTSKRPRSLPRLQAGLTLIELMIVTVVIAILAAVAIPSYTEYVRRSNRVTAASFLADVASRQAQYLLDARSYAPSLAALGMTAPNNVASKYNLTISASSVAGSPPTFTVVATPTGGQSGERCGVLSINQQGAKTASGGTSDQCW
jgi:type IV pilus assembly protein PilE